MMDDNTWIKFAQYMGAMNGENRNRDDYVTTPEAKEAERVLIEKEELWQQWLGTLSESDRKNAEEMKDCLEAYASAQENRAYIQGHVDCIQILYHMGLLRENEKLAFMEGISEKRGRE